MESIIKLKISQFNDVFVDILLIFHPLICELCPKFRTMCVKKKVGESFSCEFHNMILLYMKNKTYTAH